MINDPGKVIYGEYPPDNSTAREVAIYAMRHRELRDRFALAALPLATQLRIAAGDISIITPYGIAEDAYVIADAMLKAREAK